MPRKTFKKIITSEELIEQINTKNKKLIRTFLKDKERKCSPQTIKNYQSDLNIFFCWNVENNDNKFFPEIKKFEVSDFFSYCVDELKWNGKRFARMRSVLSGLSDCVVKYMDDDYPTYHNFINSVIESIPKQAVREKTVLKDEEIDNLLDTLKNNGEVQQACLLALAAYSGSRIAELEQFNIDTIDENNTAFNGLMLETTHAIRCKGFGKEGALYKREIIKDLFLPYYKEWVKERAKILKELGKEDEKALFINSNGNKASKTVFRDWSEQWERILQKPFYFHSLRHYMVSSLQRQGASNEFIVAVIHWKTADMVNIYSDIEDKDKSWDDTDKLKDIFSKKIKDK